MKKNQVKIYNLIFPIWLLWLIPATWIVVLPANFLIDPGCSYANNETTQNRRTI